MATPCGNRSADCSPPALQPGSSSEKATGPRSTRPTFTMGRCELVKKLISILFFDVEPLLQRLLYCCIRSPVKERAPCADAQTVNFRCKNALFKSFDSGVPDTVQRSKIRIQSIRGLSNSLPQKGLVF